MEIRDRNATKLTTHDVFLVGSSSGGAEPARLESLWLSFLGITWSDEGD